MTDQDFCSGFISLIGRPNVGKSTLLNQLAGMQLAITSPKPQTTRNLIRAIVNDEQSQMVFLDTPGMHQPKTKLGNSMKSAIQSALHQSDIIVLLIDAKAATGPKAYRGIPRIEADLLSRIFAMSIPVILLFNKIDHINKEDLLPLINLYGGRFSFSAIIPISARTGDGLSQLKDQLRQLLPQGPRLFPLDMTTDQTERSLSAELIREQILYNTEKEIPHGTAVDIEEFLEKTDPETEERLRVDLHAVIYCEKASHKGIIIGKNGSMLKQIGTEARKRIEQMLGCPCYLELFVKVREDWRNRPGILHNLGYDQQD